MYNIFSVSELGESDGLHIHMVKLLRLLVNHTDGSTTTIDPQQHVTSGDSQWDQQHL